MNVENIKKDFPLLENRNITYLDSGATTQKPIQVINAIEEGKTLIIDELDSSLHFKITRAIMSMFNNDINKKAQLIATLHDISLLDCKKMFRKEQIWFTDKNDEGTEVYSLKEFSYDQTGIRDTTDIQDKYSKGAFGAIPDPDLISTLLEVNMDEEV